MQEQFAAIEKNDTWQLVPRPRQHSVIGVHWVFKTKYAADGSLDKWKARLAAKGYAQCPGVDYDETFTPTACMTTIITILALAAHHQWHVYQMDIKSAFLNGDLKDIDHPLGFEVLDSTLWCTACARPFMVLHKPHKHGTSALILSSRSKVSFSLVLIPTSTSIEPMEGLLLSCSMSMILSSWAAIPRTFSKLNQLFPLCLISLESDRGWCLLCSHFSSPLRIVRPGSQIRPPSALIFGFCCCPDLQPVYPYICFSFQPSYSTYSSPL